MDIVALSDDEAPVTSEPAASSHEIRQAAANVTALSDDEAVEALPDKPQKRKRSRRVSYVLVRGAVVRALAGACRCRRARDDNRNCLDGFQDALDDLTALRVKLLSLHKQDMDEEALGLKYLNCSFHHGPWFLGERISVGFLQLLLLVDIPPILTKLCWRWNCKLVDPMGQVSKMLGGQRGPGRGRSLSLLGKPCCLSPFRKLLGVGSGRICRLTAAVKQGQPCPLDGRFLTRSKLNLVSLKAAKKRAILEEMLQSISEPQPEAWRKQEGIPKELQMRKPRGRRPMRTLVQRGQDRSQMRLLPPGSYSDYLRLLNARLEPAEKVSLKTFNADPHSVKGVKLLVLFLGLH